MAIQNHSLEAGSNIDIGEPAMEATILPEVLEHFTPRDDGTQVMEGATMGESDPQLSRDILLQESIVVSPPMVSEALTAPLIDPEVTQVVDEDESLHITQSVTITPGRGKRKRGADIDEENSLLQTLENTGAKKLQPTSSATSSRKIRSAVASLEETRVSPKAMKVDERETSPKGSKTQNTPEKQAWQEMKAVEFGLRSRSKSKSTP